MRQAQSAAGRPRVQQAQTPGAMHRHTEARYAVHWIMATLTAWRAEGQRVHLCGVRGQAVPLVVGGGWVGTGSESLPMLISQAGTMPAHECSATRCGCWVGTHKVSFMPSLSSPRGSRCWEPCPACTGARVTTSQLVCRGSRTSTCVSGRCSLQANGHPPLMPLRASHTMPVSRQHANRPGAKAACCYFSPE